MSDNLPVVRRSAGLARVPGKALARTVGEIEAHAIVQTARIEATAYVVYSGLQAAANLAEVESRLIQRSPLAEARLRFIGDTGAAKIAAIIEGLRP